MSFIHDIWPALNRVDGVDGGGEYNIVDPRSLYLGKSYSDYVIDWFGWLLSAKADNRNSGPVVFTTSKRIPDRSTPGGSNFFNLLELGRHSTRAAFDPNSSPPTLYVNEPHIRIGSNRLQIFEDQAVFVPIVSCYDFADAPYKDWGYMQDQVGLMIDNGDNPPDPMQLSINNQPINLPPDLPMSEFRIITPIFSAIVPDAPYGTSIKDFLEEEISPGVYPSIVDGYYVMLRFRQGRYWVHSWASAGREVNGAYFSELLYQIEVSGRRPCIHRRITARRPAQFQGVANLLAIRMREDGQLTDPEHQRFRLIQEGVNMSLSAPHDSLEKLGSVIPKGLITSEEIRNLKATLLEDIKHNTINEDKFLKLIEELRTSILCKSHETLEESITPKQRLMTDEEIQKLKGTWETRKDASFLIHELEKLVSLIEKGFITDKQFQELKATLLQKCVT